MLKEKAVEHKSPLWKQVASDLEKSSKRRSIVNLYKINRYARADETVIVAGKVLSVGDLDHKVTVAAFNFSVEATEKINKVGKAISITELIKEAPQGKRIRILG